MRFDMKLLLMDEQISNFSSIFIGILHNTMVEIYSTLLVIRTISIQPEVSEQIAHRLPY